MSFMSAAECSSAGNPLSQFTKHVQDDKSLQRDRLVGRRPSALQEGMRSASMGRGQDQMMDGFMQQASQMPTPHGPSSAFAMEQMRRELERLPQRSGSPGWAAEFDVGIPTPEQRDAPFQRPGGNGFNAADFAKFRQQTTAARTATPPVQAQPQMAYQGYQRPMPMGYMNGGMSMMNSYSPMFQQHDVSLALGPGKGKARMVELDDNNWEEQFKALESEQSAQQLDDEAALDTEASAAMERELDDMDRSVPPLESGFDDFESVWRGIQAETAHARQLADEDDFLEGMSGIGDFGEWENFDGGLGEYLFEDDNLFKDLSDPFAEGVKIMEEGGNLSLAALAFEAAVQKDAEHVEAWVKLGAAQAQNEKETAGIRALEQALKLDASNTEALMGLAVSYTNEGYDSTAYRTLERWLNTKYPGVVTRPLSDKDRRALHEAVTQDFIKAAQLSPSGEQMDPDVQVGLGVLFFCAEEFDKAVDCFSSALASTESGTTNQQSQLHLLWNRLGATLANSGRCEDAIDAYERALALRPNFVRARYNLGVSCTNIGCYEQAVQHLLGALAMHQVVEREGRERAREIVEGGNAGAAVNDADLDRLIRHNESTNLYDTLRRVFGQMGRRDLGDLVGPGMDLDVFRKDFEF